MSDDFDFDVEIRKIEKIGEELELMLEEINSELFAFCKKKRRLANKSINF